VVARIKPTFLRAPAASCLPAMQLRRVGEVVCLARLEQTKRLLQAEGLFDRSAEEAAAFSLPRGHRSRHRRR
jgi:exodeoxyribonuclease VII large subunit